MGRKRKRQIGRWKETKSKALVRKTVLPILYRTKKGRRGFTIGGVKVKVKRYTLAPTSRKEMQTGGKTSYGLFAEKKFLGHRFKKQVF